MFVTLGKARRDCFSQCNAGANVVQVHMWCVVTLGEARRDCFSQCNAGADVVQVHMWCVFTLGEARHVCFSQCNAGAGSQEVAHTSDSSGRVTVDKLWGGSVKRRQFAWQAWAMCNFESKEVCEPLPFDCKSECTGLRKLVVWDAVCGAGAVRVRRGFGAWPVYFWGI